MILVLSFIFGSAGVLSGSKLLIALGVSAGVLAMITELWGKQ